MSYHLIKYYYETGAYTLEQVVKHVQQGDITEEEFHFITSLNYQSVLKLMEE